MKFLIVEEPQIEGRVVVLRTGQEHHLRDVCRIPSGHPIEVLVHGTERLLSCNVGEKARELLIKSERAVPSPPGPPVIVALSTIRGAKLEEAVEALTAMGVDEIHVMKAQRSQLDHTTFDKMKPRLDRLLIQVCQQAGRYQMPKLQSHASLAQFLAAHKDRVAERWIFAADETPAAESVSWIAPVGEPPRSQIVLIGPEGDFTPDEIEKSRQGGVKIVRLKGGVLRSELAAIVCTTLALARAGRV